jgi:hypothetical protein
MVYGELGRYPLDIDIKVRTISFWAKLISGKQSLTGTELIGYVLFLFLKLRTLLLWLSLLELCLPLKSSQILKVKF